MRITEHGPDTLRLLARIGLDRSYKSQGDKDKSRTTYQDLLKLWKDADPDIPILTQAKAEAGFVN